MQLIQKELFLNTAKYTLIALAVLLTILALGSCKKNPLPEPLDYMSFALTNASGAIVDTTTPLSRGSTYGLVITATNNALIPTADYTITYTPTTAITVNVRRSNSIDFRVNNTTDTSVTVTITHRIDSSLSETITLNLAPQDYMSFALTNLIGGPPVTTTTPLSRGNNYRLTITSVSGVLPATADYTITHTPTDAITRNVTRTNSVDFRVNNTADRTVTITITHKTDSSLSETLTLNLPPQSPNMLLVLTNASGTTVTTATDLLRGATYGLVITPGGGVLPETADYTITYTPATAIRGIATNTNSVDFRVLNTAATTITITVTHRTATAMSETLTLNLAPQAASDFQADIENTTTVPNLAAAQSPLTREVLGVLNVATGTTLIKRYATESGGGSYDGTSWVNAWAATNLRNGINSITDASASRVYLVMIAGGTYKPTYSTTISTTEQGISFSMVNRVAIMGGFASAGGWGRTGTTIFSGDIGTVGNNNDNTFNIFKHISSTLNNAHLYRVTITEGNANDPTSITFTTGGGMHNNNSSPVLTEVIFSGNTAFTRGGGMYNTTGSSPVLTNVTFDGNTATAEGGGMFNNNSSSPVLTDVVFNRNITSLNGGGMYNWFSFPVLTRVVFSGNTATGTFGGGGMLNFNSSPVLTEVVFSGNNANGGGGMMNQSGSPVLTSVVFSGNTAALGGGMLNQTSSPVLSSVVFSGNTTTGSGGGMFNELSSPVIIGAVFRNNSALNGGAMYNNNDGRSGPLIVNTIFSDNTTNAATGNGPDIAVDRGNAGTENIRIAGSVLGIGEGSAIAGIVGYNGGAAVNITHHSLTNGAVRFGADATLTIRGMNFTYPTITTGSSAINLGLYVRRNGGTYYFSETEAVTSWHTSFTSTGGLNGTPAALPTTGITEDLTARDFAGNARVGRPDAGVRELP